ncbi:hypothetical protein, partial [Candidatus Magnetaquicoccus inordinatus]|uniref:hypothetical protein n=1 Tax=Candidatus Magnetaquicoccus inordinatus TaxID=2496818 RepID=UPI00129267F0
MDRYETLVPNWGTIFSTDSQSHFLRAKTAFVSIASVASKVATTESRITESKTTEPLMESAATVRATTDTPMEQIRTIPAFTESPIEPGMLKREEIDLACVNSLLLTGLVDESAGDAEAETLLAESIDESAGDAEAETLLA